MPTTKRDLYINLIIKCKINSGLRPINCIYDFKIFYCLRLIWQEKELARLNVQLYSSVKIIFSIYL
jgi:hypothetical protein